MPVEEFDALATDDPMAVVLKAAKKSYAKPARAKSTGEPKVNYSSLEHAGKPHRGKINDSERQIVRDHFDQVNERLAGEGLRTIDLADPEHVSRYGLDELAAERVAVDSAVSPTTTAGAAKSATETAESVNVE
jgi:hypothetical protein